MSLKWLSLGVAAGMMMFADPAAAQGAPERPDLTHAVRGTTYYNLPGASWADHQAAVRDCMTTTANGRWGYRDGDSEVFIDPVTSRMGWFQGFVENCMVLKGWRVVQMNPWKARDYGRYQAPALARLLSPWVGAEQPEGEIVRVYANEAARADTVFWRRQAISPPWTFSIRAADDLYHLPRYPGAQMDWPGAPGYEEPPPGYTRTAPPYEEPLTAEELTRLPAGVALLLVRVRNVEKRPDTYLTVTRIAPTEELMATQRGPSLTAGNSAGIGSTRGVKSRPESERADMILAFPVNPGRYRISARGAVDFCFGAPATEVGAGEIVYLGDLNLGEGNLEPNMAMDPAQAWVRETLPGAESRLRAAEWVNGSTTACNNGIAYALEFPGYPFEDGYIRGSIPVARWAEQSTRPPL